MRNSIEVAFSTAYACSFTLKQFTIFNVTRTKNVATFL